MNFETLNASLACFTQSLFELLVPSANAMSCKAKKGSKVTYAPGILVPINLQEAQLKPEPEKKYNQRGN